MTVVSSAAADGFIERLPKEMRFYLIHGPDEGLAHERAKAIVRNLIDARSDPLRLVRLEGDNVARDPGALADEANAVSMFGGARVIWIDAQGRDLLPALEPLFARPPTDCAIVVKAGQLRRGTGLRTAFESSAARASIECYSDDPNALEALIEAEARAVGLSIAPDARAALVALTGADRQTTRGEIAKLMLYARGTPLITAEDVEAIVSDAAPSNLDEVVDQALLGDLAAVEASLTRFFDEGGDADHLMMRLVQRLLLLHRLRLEMDQGRPFDSACQALFVKLPASARRALARQAERWTSESIAQRLPAVRQASARVRADSRLAAVLATRALWALASRGRGGRH
ncbi:MAG TPA: DNA polymerase III subunit delta [Roseiarcus sp.]